MIRIAICDDEIAEREKTHRYLEELDVEAEIMEFQGGQALLTEYELKGCRFDLIFLDIHMRGQVGIEVAKELRKYDDFVKIVFVTYSRDYYSEAFGVYAFNYLLKPLEKEKLEAIVKRAQMLIEDEVEKVLVIRTGTLVSKVRYRDIAYVEVQGRILTIHQVGGKVLAYYGKMVELEQQLTDERFYRCQRSFLVNLAQVTKMDSDSFRIGDSVVPVSKHYKKKSKEKYCNYLLNKRNFS